MTIVFASLDAHADDAARSRKPASIRARLGGAREAHAERADLAAFVHGMVIGAIVGRAASCRDVAPDDLPCGVRRADDVPAASVAATPLPAIERIDEAMRAISTGDGFHAAHV
jgi:hypothetical protein